MTVSEPATWEASFSPSCRVPYRLVTVRRTSCSPGPAPRPHPAAKAAQQRARATRAARRIYFATTVAGNASTMPGAVARTRYGPGGEGAISLARPAAFVFAVAP